MICFVSNIWWYFIFSGGLLLCYLLSIFLNLLINGDNYLFYLLSLAQIPEGEYAVKDAVEWKLLVFNCITYTNSDTSV